MVIMVVILKIDSKEYFLKEKSFFFVCVYYVYIK